MTSILRLNADGISYLSRPSEGPVIVFLHGIGSNAHSFERVFSEFPPDFSLLAWNAPGYLGSEPLTKEWPRPDDYARALAEFLDCLGVERFVLLGHSLGTLIAAEFARLFPQRVAQLILVSAANGYDIPVGGEIPPKVNARIEELNALGPRAFSDARSANLVFQPDRNGDVVEQVKSGMSAVNPHGYAQAVRMLASGNLCSCLRAGTICPDFVIGAEDRITPFEQTQLAMAAWNETHSTAPRLVVLENAGHAVYAQVPGEFIKAISGLVAARPGATAAGPS